MNSRLCFINTDESTFRKVLFELLQHLVNEIPKVIRINILGANLNNTGAPCSCCSKDCAKVKIMSEEDISIRLCPCHYFAVWIVWHPNLRPVKCLEAFLTEDPHPIWGKIHVYEEFHAGT